jgi:hypothetical protein
VIRPVNELVSAPAVDTFRITPSDEIPLPEMVNGSPTDRFVPETFIAPADTVVPEAVEPSEVLFDTTTTPALTVVEPE